MAQTPLEVVIKGCLAGLAGALAIRFSMQATAPTPPPEAPVEETDPRYLFVGKVSSCLFEKEMADSERRSWAELAHWVYGSLWGMLYGVLQSSLRVPSLLHGLLLGTVVWVAGPLFLGPAMRLVPPPRPSPLGQTLTVWGHHAVYGVATAVVYGLLRGDGSR